MSAGGAGALLIVQELWPGIAPLDEWLYVQENFPGWEHGQGWCCFTEISHSLNGDRKGKGHVLVTKVLKNNFFKYRNTETSKMRRKRSLFFPLFVTVWTLLDEMAKADIHNFKEMFDIIVEIWKWGLHKTVKETSVKSLPRAQFFFLIYWKILE